MMLTKSISRAMSVIVISFPLFSQAAFTPIIPGETEVGNRNTSVKHTLSFELAEIPAKPRFEIKFTVKSTGVCQTWYKPTVLSMNGEKFAEVDFRYYSLGTDKTLNYGVPPHMLRLGENQFEIVTGECQYGVDSMNMKSITLQ